MASLPATPSTIKGKVTNARNNQPIVRVQIKLTYILGRTKASTLTDINGNYELRNLSFPRYGGLYILKVLKDGYASKAITCFLKMVKLISLTLP